MNHAAYFVDIFICAPSQVATGIDVLVPRCVAQPPPLSWWELASRSGFVHIFKAQLVDTCSSLRARLKCPEPRNNRDGGHARVTQHASPESRECERLGSGYARSKSRPSTHQPQPWNPSELSAVIPLATRHLCAAGVILPACSHAPLGWTQAPITNALHYSRQARSETHCEKGPF